MTEVEWQFDLPGEDIAPAAKPDPSEKLKEALAAQQASQLALQQQLYTTAGIATIQGGGLGNLLGINTVSTGGSYYTTSNTNIIPSRYITCASSAPITYADVWYDANTGTWCSNQ